ncbi:26S proteasome non-ATPase regulatory subunit 9 [Tothia fuscella]|uniref:Probable 26S proteasome regulatory subunit p27 n=1 Tax=Tothia fuscella TaxID=1048955 RepID=A0A9P4U293_9PEZI|nr:26S proteasome non-ATPase regulatory subunit 9 [Tothia fuscella]
MVIRMDDIHTPTVASGPTLNRYSNGVAKEKMTFKQLTDEKDRLEGELSALSAVLDSHGVNMNTGLTTFDGYPRADIDVAQIRTTRARIIHIRNDYKALMSRIELAVQAQFAENASRPSQSTTTMSQSTTSSTNIPPQQAAPSTPFAKVNSVVDGSPAAEAGLRAQDLITRFGGATWLNHDKLSKVAEVVNQNEGRPIAISIKRGEETLSMALTPRRNWGGRGMLGCHLLPI